MLVYIVKGVITHLLNFKLHQYLSVCTNNQQTLQIYNKKADYEEKKIIIKLLFNNHIMVDLTWFDMLISI